MAFLIPMTIGYSLFTDTIYINGSANGKVSSVVIPPDYPVGDGTKLLTGGEVRNKITNLATNNFTAFLHSSEAPDNLEAIKNDATHIISTSDSTYPVYIWVEGTSIYWWSEGTPSANSMCNQMFKECKKMTDCSGLEGIDFYTCTNMYKCFINVMA